MATWAVEQRLDYIDQRLLTEGTLRRGDLTQKFGISVPQASTDLSAFQALYPGAMTYDRSGKKYEPTEKPYRSRRGVAMIEPRFFFDQDGSSHWYIVPADKRAEWDAWRAIPEDDERAWEAPAFAKRMEGGPEFYTFTDPRSVF